MFSSNSRPLPPRTHSINAVKDADYFGSINEQLRDCKRVQRQGQEEDLREALDRMMTRVEEMCETLKLSYETTTDLETLLTLAESNLKLALANNEMLEDALKSSPLPKDVGWRRSSRDTISSPVPLPASQSQATVDENEPQRVLDSPGSDHDSGAPSPVPTPPTDSRFFRFRFTASGRSTPTQSPNSPPPRASRPHRISHPTAGHLTSASLPSLVAPLPSNNELDELREQLLVEKGKSEKLARDKSELESELESLSQALFEEANKMVKVERIKRAEAEDELKDVHAEKEALKSALRLIEEDRMRVESVVHHAHHVNGIQYRTDTTTTTHSRTSSLQAVISPRRRDSPALQSPSPPPQTAQSQSPQSQSPTTSRTTAARDPDDDDDDDGHHNTAPPSPAPLYVPPPHLADSAPASRTASPKPLPHPHRLSHLRPAPPAPPPPSAADGFPTSPWACPPLDVDGEEEEEDAETRLSVPPMVTLYSPPGEAEVAVPWGKW